MAGWHTTRPTQLPLSSGDGLKTFNLWAYRADGTPLSINVTSAAIKLDRTLPGNFSVTGVVSQNEDMVLDSWLTSHELPLVKWTDSGDATDYSLQIRNASSQIICEKFSLSAPANSYNFSNADCDNLINGQTYTLSIRSFDVARNPVSTSDFNFTVDLTPPEAFTIVGVNGGSDVIEDGFIGTTLPTIHFINASGASHYEVEIQNSSNTRVCTLASKAAPATYFDYAYESGVSCVLLDGGLYQAYVTAIDSGLNKTLATNTGYLFRVDQQIPALAITSAPIVLTQSTNAAINFTAADSSSGLDEVSCSFDGRVFSTCSSPQNFTGLAEGLHTFEVKAIDIAGNLTTQSETWRVDRTGPTVSIASGPSGYQAGNSASFSFSAVDPEGSGTAQYQCSFDGGQYSICTSPQNYSSLRQGVHSFAVRAADNLGNLGSSATRTWTTDYSAPVVNITSAPSSGDTNTAPSISFTSSDSESGIVSTKCRWDSGSWVTCTSPASASGLSLGSHTFDVRVANGAGTAATDTHTWTINSYSWLSDAWGACSVTCGGGTQSRSVTCQRNDSEAVTDPFCTATKPDMTQSCNAQACEIVVTVSSDTNHINAKNLFSASDWSSTTPKRVIIASGVTVGSTSSSTPAFRTGTDNGGTIAIENRGSIQGAGGVANSGAGGTAFFADTSGVSLNNTGTIYGGGGAGGVGGTGGGGSYDPYPNSRNALGITYPSEGGAGGSGGRGQGYDGANTSGLNGSSGGTNAGTGGTGGSGGGWGAAGGTGSPGASGNRSSGTGGTAGGLAGYGIQNLGNVSLTNTGTILGR